MERSFIIIKKLVGIVEQTLTAIALLVIVLSVATAIHELYIGSVISAGMRWVYQAIVFFTIVEALLAGIYTSGCVALASIKRKLEKNKPESVKMKEFGMYMIKMSEELEKEEKKNNDAGN